jgi:hypothetical protein
MRGRLVCPVSLWSTRANFQHVKDLAKANPQPSRDSTVTELNPELGIKFQCKGLLSNTVMKTLELAADSQD